MKKLLSALVLIAVLMTACFVGAMPTAAAEINYDDFDIYDGILVEYLGPGGDVVIPSKDADGNPVTEIDGKAFYDNDDITSVVIPEGITKIGSEAFSFCDYLEKVSLPYSLETCGISIFRRSPAISKITIPANLKNVPQDFCSGCTSLTEVVISYGVETIGVYAFCDMQNLERIVFSETVKEIYGLALSNSTSDKTEVVICNPMCELGYMNGYAGNKGYASPFGSPQHKKTAWTFIVPEGSTVAKDLEAYNNPNYRIRTADKTYFDELPENQSDFGVQSAEDAQEEAGVDENGEQIGENNGENGSNAATNNGTGLSFDLTKILIIVGAIFGGIILLIVIIIVVVIILKNNKKKKKAAAKAARRAAKKAAMEAEATPVEEAPVDEVPADEVPADDAE